MIFSPASKLDRPGQALDNTALNCIMLQRTKLLPVLRHRFEVFDRD